MFLFISKRTPYRKRTQFEFGRWNSRNFIRVTRVHRRITRILFLFFFFLVFSGKVDGSGIELGICRNGLERSRTCFHTGSVGYMPVYSYVARKFLFKTFYFYILRIFFSRNILLYECFFLDIISLKAFFFFVALLFFQYYIAIFTGYYSIEERIFISCHNLRYYIASIAFITH